LFIHNFLPFCEDGKFGALKVDRFSEFAPVKNADGETEVADSPAQAKRMYLELCRRWVTKINPDPE
jgi:UDP-N-acetylglucosamine pyrophosphorylase